MGSSQSSEKSSGMSGDAARVALLRPVLVGHSERGADAGSVGLGLAGMAEFLPEEWLTSASTRFDGVVRFVLQGERAEDVSARRVSALRGALVGAGVPEDLAGHCAAVLPVMGRVATEDTDAFMTSGQAMAVVDGVTAMTSLMEACRMLAARDLATEAGQAILADRELESADEMSTSSRERWEATCRALSAEELSAATGLGRWHTREMAAIGLAPVPVSEAVLVGLRTGVARWPLVAAFWRRCWTEKKLSQEDAGEIAEALFGIDLDEVVVERIAADGSLSLAPWADKEFYQALEREATRREAKDPESVAADRAAQHEQRTAYGIVDDDGAGQVIITGNAASTSACVDRLHLLARRARAAGDPRRESQLRSDIARALLLHGTLPLPELADEAGLVTPDQIEDLVMVLSGAPSYELQVVVPWDALTGHAAIVNQGTQVNTCTHGNPCTPGDPCSHVNPCTPGDVDRPLDGRDPTHEATVRPPDLGDPAAGDGVGRLLGRFPRFLTKAEILAIAGGPGVTMSRLLVDPADGRCIERSIQSYRPDATMRAQIRAADVFSRFPGSTFPVRDGDLDHVIPYLLGGATAEPNLQGLERIGHGIKTRGHWEAQMDATRNVTWTTYFARLYTTRTHDYRQYLSTRSALPGPTTGRTSSGTTAMDTAARETNGRDAHVRGGDPRVRASELWRDQALTEEERQRLRLEERHLASLLTYAALVARHAGAPLEKPGDDPTTDEELVDDSFRSIWVRHTRADGKKVGGPRPGTPTPEQLLGTDPQELLDARHWTELFDVTDEVTNDDTNDDTNDGMTGSVAEDSAQRQGADALDGSKDLGDRDPGDEDDGTNWSSDDPIPF